MKNNYYTPTSIRFVRGNVQHTISFQRGAFTGLWENGRRLAFCMTAINFTLSRVKCFFHAPYLLKYAKQYKYILYIHTHFSCRSILYETFEKRRRLVDFIWFLSLPLTLRLCASNLQGFADVAENNYNKVIRYLHFRIALFTKTTMASSVHRIHIIMVLHICVHVRLTYFLTNVITTVVIPHKRKCILCIYHHYQSFSNSRRCVLLLRAIPDVSYIRMMCYETVFTHLKLRKIIKSYNDVCK